MFHMTGSTAGFRLASAARPGGDPRGSEPAAAARADVDPASEARSAGAVAGIRGASGDGLCGRHLQPVPPCYPKRCRGICSCLFVGSTDWLQGPAPGVKRFACRNGHSPIDRIYKTHNAVGRMCQAKNTVKKSVRYLSTIVFDVMDPLYQKHPEVKPADWE
jgi:hypothetical protein